MKTAVRLGPIAHLRRAKYIGNISNNQAWEFGDKPLTLIPGYLISPLMGRVFKIHKKNLHEIGKVLVCLKQLIFNIKNSKATV